MTVRHLKHLRPDLLSDLHDAFDDARKLGYWQEMDDEEGFKAHLDTLEGEVARELRRLDELLGVVFREGVRVLKARAGKGRGS